MTMITLEHQISEFETMMETSREEVARLLNELKCLRAQLERGQAPDGPHCPDVRQLTGMMKNCLEVEIKLVKCKEQHAGIAQCGFAFDLEAARASIRSKLDRIRDRG